MKVAVYGKQFQEEVAPFVLELFTELEKAQMEILVYEPFYDFLSQQSNLNLFLNTFNTYEELKNDIDLFVSVGGDGTILDATTLIRDSGIPIIGVNTGRLGFLADIAKDQIPKTIKQLVNKRFSIDERTLLKLETSEPIFGDLNFKRGYHFQKGYHLYDNDYHLYKRPIFKFLLGRRTYYCNSYWIYRLFIKLWWTYCNARIRQFYYYTYSATQFKC